MRDFNQNRLKPVCRPRRHRSDRRRRVGNVRPARGVVDSPRTPQRFAFVDALRGISALWIVIFHAFSSQYLDGLELMLPEWSRGVIHIGYVGVTVFFVLSGFVIAHSFDRRRVDAPSIGWFMIRRSVRLDPPYWASIAITLAVARRALPSAAALLAHMFYLQDLLRMKPVSPIYWTLCLEIQFYLVFALLLGVAYRLGFRRHRSSITPRHLRGRCAGGCRISPWAGRSRDTPGRPVFAEVVLLSRRRVCLLGHQRHDPSVRLLRLRGGARCRRNPHGRCRCGRCDRDCRAVAGSGEGRCTGPLAAVAAAASSGKDFVQPLSTAQPGDRRHLWSASPAHAIDRVVAAPLAADHAHLGLRRCGALLGTGRTAVHPSFPALSTVRPASDGRLVSGSDAPSLQCVPR